MAKKAQEVKKEPLHIRDFENMDDTAILQQVVDDMRTSDNFQSPYFDNFRRFYQGYKSYIEEKDKKENRSNLFIPYTYHVIETITPKIVLGMFSSRPYVRTMPLGLSSEIREKRSKKMNKLLDYQFQQKIKLVPIVTDVIKSMAIYGTAITKQSWNFKIKKVIKRRQKTMLGMPIPGAFEDVLVESVVADDPTVTLIPILDFFFDPAGTTIADCRYVIHRYYEDLHELKDKAKQAKGLYRNIDKLEIEKGTSPSTDANNNMLDNIGIPKPQNGVKDVEIWEYWLDDWVVKVANKKAVIYSERNPYFHMSKPFAKWSDNAMPNEFYAGGEVEPIEPLQEELNTTRNQRIDNVSFVLNKMWKILRGANVDTKQLISRPAGFIEVDEMTDVEELKFTDVTSSAYQEEAVIKQDIDRTSGVHDTERGSAPSRRETATTMNILANAGGERFKLKTLLTELGGFHDCVNQIIALDQQYIDRPKEIILLGDDGVVDNDTVSPEEILGGWAIVGVGSAVEPSVNREAQQQQMTQLYGILQQNPYINQQEMLKRLFEVFDMKNPDALLAQQTPMIPGIAGESQVGGIPGNFTQPPNMGGASGG